MVKNSRNPNNKESTLFRALTRLLSGPINSRRAAFYRQERRRSLDKYSSKFLSLSGKEFKKSAYNPFEYLETTRYQNYNRLERYAEFDAMDNSSPEINSCLDLVADEMTTWTTLRPMLEVKHPNDEIRLILENLYFNILNVNFNLFGWCRNMLKYGDFFLYLDIDEELGIKSVIGLPHNELERLEGEDEKNPRYVQFQWNNAGLTFENWQVSHLRILGNDKYAPYGSSYLDGCRRIYRQLDLLENTVIAYRVVRSSERRVFYIDVGNIDPKDTEQYIEKIKTSLRRHSIIDEDTGRVDLRWNPSTIEEDYFIPVRRR